MFIYLLIYVLNTCDGKQTFIILSGRIVVLLGKVYFQEIIHRSKTYSDITLHLCVCRCPCKKNVSTFALQSSLFGKNICTWPNLWTYSRQITLEKLHRKKRRETCFINKSYTLLKNISHFENNEQKCVHTFQVLI